MLCLSKFSHDSMYVPIGKGIPSSLKRKLNSVSKLFSRPVYFAVFHLAIFNMAQRHVALCERHVAF